MRTWVTTSVNRDRTTATLPRTLSAVTEALSDPFFCEQATELLKQTRVLKQQNDKLRAARDLLLPRLMTGQIAV